MFKDSNKAEKAGLWLSLVVVLAVTSSCRFGVPIQRDDARQLQLPKTQTSQKTHSGPASYVVYGQQYHVMNSSVGFTERGIASWYGKKFHGRKTSNGEIYNMYAMTAAHKTLPLPTWVRVENLENGKSIVVRVNDRGPFVGTRIIDLSYTAAKQLDMISKGTAKVEISALKSANDRSRPAVRTIALKDEAATEPKIYVQLGSFTTEVNALNLKIQLMEKQEKAVRIAKSNGSDSIFYRVQIGPLLDLTEAQKVAKRLKQKGFKQSRIVIP